MIAGTRPTDAGFEAALAAARRRRLQSLFAATTATACVVGALASVAPAVRRDARHRVDVTDGGVRPSPGPTEAGTVVPGSSHGPDPVVDVAAPGPRGDRVLDRRATPSVAPAAKTTAAPARLLRRPVRFEAYESQPPNVYVDCRPPQPCLEVWFSRRTREVRLSVCIGDSADNLFLHGKRLTYPTAQEVEFVITGPDRFRWTWSVGQRFAAAPFSRPVAADCMKWWTTWDDLRGDDGRPAPSGRFRLEARSLSYELAGHSATSYFTLDRRR